MAARCNETSTRSLSLLAMQLAAEHPWGVGGILLRTANLRRVCEWTDSLVSASPLNIPSHEYRTAKAVPCHTHRVRKWILSLRCSAFAFVAHMTVKKAGRGRYGPPLWLMCSEHPLEYSEALFSVSETTKNPKTAIQRVTSQRRLQKLHDSFQNLEIINISSITHSVSEIPRDVNPSQNTKPRRIVHFCSTAHPENCWRNAVCTAECVATSPLHCGNDAWSETMGRTRGRSLLGAREVERDSSDGRYGVS